VIALAAPFVSAEHWSRRPPGAFLNLAKVGKILVEAAGKEYENCCHTYRLLQVALAHGILSSERLTDDSHSRQHLCNSRMVELHDVYESLQSSIPAVYEPQSVEEREICYLARIAFNRCICVTRRGNLALVPLETRVGDAVAVLHGSKVPLILRDQPTENMYRVVGQAYVENMMRGEAVTWTVEEAKEYVLI
jgi:hypothetical protein